MANQFKIFILNITKSTSNLICDTMNNYGYSCDFTNDIEYAMKYIKNNNFDLLLINVDDIEDIHFKILKDIRKITNINIIFLTNEINIQMKNQFLEFNLLDYKIKLNNILTLLSEIDKLIKKLILNAKETILIVKAPTKTRKKIESLLKLRQYNVKIANNGAHGWKEINQSTNLSLIILDINLNDMDSLEILNIAKRKYSDDIPVIALSVEYNPVILQQNISNGLSDLLNVPIIDEEFNLKIDLWIDNVRQKKEIKRQQLQLKQSLNGFKALSNATIEGLIMFENNICVDANDASLVLFKYDTKEELLNKNILEIVPENISTYDKEELLKNDVNHELELDMKKQDGTIFPTQIKERNIMLDNRDLKILAILDLTDIKRKENMLHHQSKMASMGEMMGNIAHQWRQPLTAISIAASGMKISYELDLLDENEIVEQLDSIVNSTEFLSNTINDFQSFLKGNKIKENFTISNTVKKVLNLIGNNLKKANIQIVEKYNDDMQIYGLQNELVQALLNIINNAKDAIVSSENNGLNLLIINSYSNNENINLSIQDSAGGIPKDVIDKIFEPYFTTKHQSQGTGLGLYMTHQMIVDYMGGTIKVSNCEFTFEDNLYFGANFNISIPINKQN